MSLEVVEYIGVLNESFLILEVLMRLTKFSIT